MNYTLMILGMALITVLTKASFFLLGDRVQFPPSLQRALAFVPVTVLTALIVPMVLAPHEQGIELHWRNPQLVGALVAIAVCLRWRNQLLTIIVGLAAYFMWRAMLL